MKNKTIVVGFDGSKTALRAIDVASQLVDSAGTVHVVTAYTLPDASETGAILDQLPADYELNYDLLSTPRADLDRAADLLAGSGATTVTHLVDDNPAAAILDIADTVNAELIIVGSRGKSRASRFLHGSVSTRIANHSRRSFMVVHDPETPKS